MLTEDLKFCRVGYGLGIWAVVLAGRPREVQFSEVAMLLAATSKLRAADCREITVLG